MDELNVFGTVFMAILGIFIYWLSSSTVFIIIWVAVTLFYAKSRWLERFLSADEGAEEAAAKHGSVARTRSMKSGLKKYDWGSYDATYNEHWRQRLMSFSAVQLPPTKSGGKSSPMHYSPTPDAHKSRGSPHFPLNKSPSQTMGKMRKNAEETARSEWVSPLKSYQPNYSLGVYPKVNLQATSPILLTDYRGNMKKKRVTVKLSPVERPPEPEIDMQMDVEPNIMSNLKKSSRKRQLKLKPAGDLLKKQRVGESPIESVLPDHFIEDASTSTNALKNLEKAHHALSPPKTNAIDSSFSSMKRMRNQTLNSRKRNCSSVEGASIPKPKIQRKESEQVQEMETSSQEISLEKSPPRVATPPEKSTEADDVGLIETRQDNDEVQEEGLGLKQLYIPSLQDHLDDRDAKFQRLQNLLKKFSNSPSAEKSSIPVSSALPTRTLTSPKEPSQPEVSSSNNDQEVPLSPGLNLSTSTPLKNLPAPSALNGELKLSFPVINGVDKTPAAKTSHFGNLSAINASSSPQFQFQEKAVTPPQAKAVTDTNQFQFQAKTANDANQPQFQAKTMTDTNQFQFQAKTMADGNELQFQAKNPTTTSSSEVKSTNSVFTFGTPSLAAPSLTNGFNFSATTQPTFAFGSEASKFSTGSGSTAPRRSKLSASRNRIR